MIVVKVGGSLYEMPDITAKFNHFLQPLALDQTVIVVPGGGAVVEALREWDLRFGIGEKRCHDFALKSMALAGKMLHRTIEGSRWCADDDRPGEHGIFVITQFRDQYHPETWDMTSDSMAVQIAIRFNAEKLILLKSVEMIANISWFHAADLHIVDRHFPNIVREFSGPVDIINFRTA